MGGLEPVSSKAGVHGVVGIAAAFVATVAMTTLLLACGHGVFVVQRSVVALVGVSRGRRHKEPKVSGGQELRCQLAVAFVDRVDIGRVKDRESTRDLGRRCKTERVRVVAGDGRPWEVGQDPVRREPLGVLGMVHEDG